MRKQIVSLAAVAALALVGVGAATTTAQAAPQAIKISEVLINTKPDAATAQLDGVELVKPAGTSSLDGYKIQACGAPDAITGVSMLETVATLDTLRNADDRTAASNQTGIYDYNLTGALSRDGGVRLINTAGTVVDAVAFTDGAGIDAGVETCLKTDNPNADVVQAPKPTDFTSPQRQDNGASDDTGDFAPVSVPPTFEPQSGSENII